MAVGTGWRNTLRAGRIAVSAAAAGSGLAAAPAAAATVPPGSDASAICESVALSAAQRTGVPPEVMRAVSLTETGRGQAGAFRPWPWTVNMEGEGHWFDTADEARAYVFREFKRGARSFDVGCFQINYKWHGDAFTSIDEMFDPVANALYAGRLLRSLYDETGSWGAAAGAYHSRTPELAGRYQQRFERILASLTGNDLPAAGEGAAPGEDIPEIPDIVLAQDGGPEGAKMPRVNSYPLLIAGGTFGNGSLVPIEAANPVGQPAPAGLLPGLPVID